LTDVAVLGLSVDSRNVVAAKKALDDLTASAKPAAAAAAALEKSTVSAGKGAQQLATGTGLARHEMVNLSRQIQDVGVSLASGQSPFMVLAQQGTQIADIFGSSKTGTVGGAFKQIVNFIGPMRLLGLGLAGVAVGGGIAINSLANSAKALDDTARSIGTTTRELSKLQAAASVKGIDGEEFTKGITSFGKGVYDAQKNMGGLAEMFRANNVQAKTFNDYLFRVADLIKNAKDDQQRLQLLQQAGLPATMQWVRLLSGGADGLAKLKSQMVEFAADDSMIRRAREFDEAWNRATTNAGNRMKNWLLGLDELTFSAIEKFKEISANTWGSGAPLARVMVTGGTAMPAAKPTVDKNELTMNIARMQPALGLFGQIPPAAQAQQSKSKPEREQERDSDRTRLPAAA
jgi:hypothetical protein